MRRFLLLFRLSLTLLPLCVADGIINASGIFDASEDLLEKMPLSAAGDVRVDAGLSVKPRWADAYDQCGIRSPEAKARRNKIKHQKKKAMLKTLEFAAAPVACEADGVAAAASVAGDAVLAFDGSDFGAEELAAAPVAREVGGVAAAASVAGDAILPLPTTSASEAASMPSSSTTPLVAAEGVRIMAPCLAREPDSSEVTIHEIVREMLGRKPRKGEESGAIISFKELAWPEKQEILSRIVKTRQETATRNLGEKSSSELRWLRWMFWAWFTRAIPEGSLIEFELNSMRWRSVAACHTCWYDQLPAASSDEDDDDGCSWEGLSDFTKVSEESDASVA